MDFVSMNTESNLYQNVRRATSEKPRLREATTKRMENAFLCVEIDLFIWNGIWSDDGVACLPACLPELCVSAEATRPYKRLAVKREKKVSDFSFVVDFFWFMYFMAIFCVVNSRLLCQRWRPKSKWSAERLRTFFLMNHFHFNSTRCPALEKQKYINFHERQLLFHFFVMIATATD